MSLCSELLTTMEGKTLATAESCTGGGIGAALTAVPGSSRVYKGGIISYWSEVKAKLLGVDPENLRRYGAVSEPVAREMVQGVRRILETDAALSVTGLAGPDGDEFGHPVGTVYIGYTDANTTQVRHFLFQGNREEIRNQVIQAALELALEYNK